MKTRRPEKSAAPVDVIVPVYRGRVQTVQCLQSVLASRNKTSFRLLVIDDASPEPELSRDLDKLEAEGSITLLRNKENLGFVKTVNRGMRYGDKDVVLLNSDTVVFDDWLDRLVAQAHAAENIATVTPLSNNATILSYPRTLETNPSVTVDQASAIDRLCADLLEGTSQDIPTGVGFCFYIKRDVLNEIGYFDEETFLKGYGEENDYCLRASKAGWRNIAACDVYVMHEGGVSFSASANEALAEGLRRLNARYPAYGSLIQDYIKEDPLAEVRRTIDLARAARGERPGLLMIDHGWGGGVDSHIADLSLRLQAEGFSVFRIAPNAAQTELRISSSSTDLPNLGAVTIEDRSALVSLLKALGIVHVHVHSIVFYGFGWVRNLLGAVRDAGLTYDVTIHDFATVCPLVQMVDASGVFCDSRSVEQCRACLSTQKTFFGPVQIEPWRALNRELLEGARRVFAPSDDTARRIKAYWPDLPDVVVRPHPVIPRSIKIEATAPPSSPIRRVALIGGIGPHKGSSVLLACAIDAIERKLPLEFVVFGNTDKPSLSELPNVRVLGRYQEDEIGALMDAHPCDIGWFPSVWPETFCYTLDIALDRRLVPVSFNLGAIPDRMRSVGIGEVLPLELASSPGAINDVFLSMDLDVDWGNLKPEVGRDWISAEAYYGELPTRRSVATVAPLRGVRGASRFARLPKNIIVTRQSPDWLSFDVETSRAFCVKHKLPEFTVVDFVALWDSAMSMPYRVVRQRLKELSQNNLLAVRDAEIVDVQRLERISEQGLHDDDLIVFVDDDDWLSPWLFGTLRLNPQLGDGALWGSIFMGALASDTPVEKAGAPALSKRPYSDAVYTNNYAITGRAMRRFAVVDVLEHADAQRLLDSGAWRPWRSWKYLSLANKHPCCTVAAHYNMLSEEFRARPASAIHRLIAELSATPFDDQTEWTRPYVRQFRAVMAAAIRERPELPTAA